MSANQITSHLISPRITYKHYLANFLISSPFFPSQHLPAQKEIRTYTAMASATLSSTTVCASLNLRSNMPERSARKVVYVNAPNVYQGLTAYNPLLGHSQPKATQYGFFNSASTMRSGARDVTCNNAAVEIFRIAAIMNGLVLVGVAVGFALLRLEASVEESE